MRISFKIFSLNPFRNSYFLASFRHVFTFFQHSLDMNSEKFDRAYGCFLGQAIGDALGTRYEFKSSTIVQTMITNDLRDEPYLPILGGGPFNNECGQVTDDTEMAMALARSIQRCKTFDVADVAKSYTRWYFSSPADIGSTTLHAFDRLPSTKWDILERFPKDEIYRSILQASNEKNKGSLSNGCLMRISPLAIAGSSWPLDTLRNAAIAECSLTHPNAAAQDAVCAYVTAIWYLINTSDRRKAFDEMLARVETPLVRRLLESNESWDVPVADATAKEVFIQGDGQRMGYLGIALKWAFKTLLSYEDNFDESLCQVMKRGGDTDTNGCITGALLGSYVGACRIPVSWKTTVLTAKPRRLETYEWVDMTDSESLVHDLLSAGPPNQL